jgi:hypothetical protein
MIAAILHLMLFAQDDGRALARTASYLSVDRATSHVAAAELAAATYDVDADLLLSIAHHESNYQYTVISKEPRGKVSCGVMTPVPTHSHAECSAARRSILAGYLAGAQHLRTWLEVCRGNRYCAEVGYAGGYRLIAACRRGEKLHGCTIPANFESRAAWIRRLRHRRNSI